MLEVSGRDSDRAGLDPDLGDSDPEMCRAREEGVFDGCEPGIGAAEVLSSLLKTLLRSESRSSSACGTILLRKTGVDSRRAGPEQRWCCDIRPR